MHLAGHLVTPDAVIDNHGDRVADSVWALYEAAVRRFGPISTLIEWDTDIPALEVLLSEAARAKKISCQVQQEMDAAQLAQSQQLFASALFDVKTAPQALQIFKGDAQLTEQRFALYRGNLSATWDKTLSSAYPVLKALVGEEFFQGLSREYGKTLPSQLGDLNHFGAQFAEFLTSFPHVAEYPYFPDMARLEWALHRAHYADNASAIDPVDVAQLAPKQLDQARLLLHPACALVESKWAIVELWQAHLPNSDYTFPTELARCNYAVVVRPLWKTMVLPLVPSAYAALRAIQNGQTLGAALDAALEVDAEFDFSFHLQQWLQHAIFVGVELVPPSDQ
jgi:hypothetical protein